MLGMPEIVIILLVVVVFLFGAKKIPELARSMGRAKAEFDMGQREARRELMETEKSDTTSGAQKQEGSKVVKAAKELGIETEGKTEDELKEEIAKAVEKK
jgi:sec-independent protein translocase protein TatA